MFKKLLHKFNHFMYRYHRKKFYKYLAKTVGAKRYDKLIPDTKEVAAILAAFNSGETHAVYADTDSVSAYPSVLPHRRFPLVNQPGSK